jgi:hypothetical protein
VIPDPPATGEAPLAGGEGNPARDGAHPSPPRAGHIRCVICTDTIALDNYRSARCWTDPGGHTCAAHAACLIRVGEPDMQLPPDPGEPKAADRGPPAT